MARNTRVPAGPGRLRNSLAEGRVVLAGHARRHLPSRLARLRAVAPMLIKNSTSPNNSFASPRTLGGGLAFDGRDPFLKPPHELGVRQFPQPTRTFDFGADTNREIFQVETRRQPSMTYPT